MITNDKKKADRELLIRLFRKLWDRDEQAAENEIIDTVYRNLHDDLKPWLMAEFGSQVSDNVAFTRFTDLLNQFFVKVLEAFPEGMERIQTRRALCAYVAMSMERMIYDRTRREARNKSCDPTLLDCLIEDLCRRFQQDCPNVQYERVLDALRSWETSGDPGLKELAQLVRYRYVLGEPQSRVQELLGVSKHKYYALHKRALEKLSREVQS